MVPGSDITLRSLRHSDDVFSVGAYALTVKLVNEWHTPPGQQPTSPVSSQTPVSTIIAPDRFEPNNTPATATWLGRITRDTISGVNLATGSDVDYYKFQAGSSGVYQVTAQGVVVQILNMAEGFLPGQQTA